MEEFKAVDLVHVGVFGNLVNKNANVRISGNQTSQTVRPCFNNLLQNFTSSVHSLNSKQNKVLQLQAVAAFLTYRLGCFIFSPFLKLKMLGVVSDRVFDADFEYAIFISL